MRLASPTSSGLQLAAVAGVGLVTGVVAGALTTPLLGALIGWDVGALCYLVTAWRVMWPSDAGETARLAAYEDPGRPLRDALLLGTCLASLLGIVGVVRGGSAAGLGRVAQLGLELVSVLLSWTVVHTLHTARYARIYYTGPDGGINFHQREPPRYRDFAYVAFTVGMTFQVSDPEITDGQMRAAVLRHAWMSYLFGAVIIAATINLLVNLVH
ncbi:DUF1345 domain-containing protein [Rhizomonospora bruguierae]|uniref:DUF1345 domain-containing protein n=1 Tax=Rhizomonospora bruguierae TaxID=1581705 RepID=UPI001BD17433|nr:DUF1345 domain-containing protein [Micromonospora sp. NBRC 107566]